MKRPARVLVIVAALLTALPAFAGVPDFVTYSGRLTDGTAWGQSTTLDLTFRVYGSDDDNDLLWQKEYPGLAVEDGYFSVLLGDGDDPGTPEVETDHNVTEIFAAIDETWITVCVGEFPCVSTFDLSPRQQIGSVPYAVRAGNTANVGGQPILKAMKLALGFSDAPGDDNYLSDAAFISYQKDECPLGYQRDMSDGNAQYVVCKKGLDEMVKVGDFWIDRYELSLWDGPCCSGQQYGVADGDAHAAGFVRSGSDVTKEMYACSRPGVSPGYWLTWFQAQRACTMAGKRLCADAEWQAAALGTPDPHTADPGDDSEPCNIWPNSKPGQAVWAVTNSATMTGSASQCVSVFGAYDMVGNVWEWTADWWGQGSDDGSQPNNGEFKGDGYTNVDNAQYNGDYPEGNPVFPASAVRGGHWSVGSQSGVFTLNLADGPAGSAGARCCRR